MVLIPKLLTTLKTYNRKQFTADLIAGLIVGVVALPLAIAFAIASGVPPEKGLITAVVAGFLISFLGGSKVQIGGPTGAFVVIVYGIVQKYGIDGLIIATIIAGAMLIAMGFFKAGVIIKFVPYPLIVGFTSGIALIIFSSQVKDFFGLSTGPVPADFMRKWSLFFHSVNSINIFSTLIAAGTVVISYVWPYINRRIPGSLIAILLSTLLVFFLKLPVETIGTRFGQIPSGLPSPVMPHLSYTVIKEMIGPAFTIAMLGGIESLLSAIVSDGMIGSRHRSNMELIAQGTANIFSGMFGGIPATGAIARTVTNIKNGGRTPVAGIIHAAVLLLIMLFFGKWATLIPLSCLAGILVVVAINMAELESFITLLKGPRNDALILAVTFLLTVFVDLTVAIEIGMVLAALLFMVRMANLTNVSVVTSELEENEEDETADDLNINRIDVPKGVEVYEINGPFFFAAAQKFEEAARIVETLPKVRILRLRKVPVIDATGLHSLKMFYQKCKTDNIRLILSGLEGQPLEVLKASDLYEEIGAENILDNVRSAVERAKEILPKKP